MDELLNNVNTISYDDGEQIVEEGEFAELRSLQAEERSAVTQRSYGEDDWNQVELQHRKQGPR